MEVLNYEIKNVQNPALGAIILWKFTVGWEQENPSTSPQLPVLFIVLPIVFHESTDCLLHGTMIKTGLRGFASKFSKNVNVKADLLLSINDRALVMRELTLHSLSLSIGTGLISLNIKSCMVHAISTAYPKTTIPTSILPLLNDANQLGRLCSSLTLMEIASILKVRF